MARGGAQGEPAACAQRRRRVPRRRGGQTAAAQRGFGWGKSREARAGRGEAYRGSILGGGWPEGGRRREGRSSGRSLTKTAMADGVWGLTSAGVGHGRARGWTEELRGEVAQLGARRIEVGRRGLAGATSDDDFARFCSLELDLAQRKEEGGLGRPGKLRGVRERRRAAPGAIADAWTRSPAFSRRYGRGRAQC